MRADRMASGPAMRLYRRFDYGPGDENHLKDVASAVAVGLFCSAFAVWVWVICAAVAAYRAGYPL